MILKCSCAHEGQDRLHGSGKRVHNSCPDPSGGVKWRCTVCNTERTSKETSTILVPFKGK